MKLKVWDNHKSHKPYDENAAFMEHNGHRLLYEYEYDGKTKQRFVFYQCDSPPEGAVEDAA